MDSEGGGGSMDTAYNVVIIITCMILPPILAIYLIGKMFRKDKGDKGE